MSELFSDRRGVAYYVEDVVFHALAFFFLGPPVIALLWAGASSLSAPAALPAIVGIFGFFWILGYYMMGLPLLFSGAAVSVVSRFFRSERILCVLSSLITVAAGFVFVMKVDPTLIVGPTELALAAITGFAMARITRFIRVRRVAGPDSGETEA